MNFLFLFIILQVQRLLVLFEAKKCSRLHQPITDRWDLSSSVDSPLNWSYSNRQHDVMPNMNTLGQATLQVQITNPKPNAERSVLLSNSNMNFPTLGSINPPQAVDPNAVTTSTHKTYHTHYAGVYHCQYPNDPAQQGILNSSSLCLGQQQEPYECQPGNFTGNLYTQRMVSHLAYNPSLQQQTQSSLLCVSCNNQQVALSGYNTLNLSSSEPVQVYASNPSYPGNIVMGISTPSNFYSRSHLQGPFYNGAPQNDYFSNMNQDLGLVGDLKTSMLAENPSSYQNPSKVNRFYPAESRNQLHDDSKSNPDPLGQDHNLSLNPNPNPNPTLYSDVEQRKSVFSRLAQKPQILPQEKHSCQAGGDLSINQLPGHLVQQSRHENGLNRADKPVCNKGVGQNQELVLIHELAGGDIEVGPDPADMVDGIDVDLAAPVFNLNVVPDEIQIPLVNFKRRSGGNKLNTQLAGDKKKRRLIRPSLALGDEDNDLCALKGQMRKVAMSSDKQSEEPFLVCRESVYKRENMVISDAIHVDDQVDDENSEILDGFQGPFCINSQSKGSDSNFKAESLGSSTGEYKDESNEMLVMMEIKSQQQKNDLEDSHGPLCNTEICLKRLPEKTTVDLECVSETKCDGSRKIPISGYEKLNTFQLDQKSLNKDGINSSKGQTESFVLGENTEKKKPVPSPEPILSESKIEIKDKCVLEIEPDNITISVCLHREEINLAEEYIPLEPEANNLETGLFSHKEKSNLVEEYIALEPDADNF